MTIKQSIWIWDNFDLVKNIVYLWRFISLIIFSAVAIAVIMVDSFKSNFSKIAIGLLLIAATIYSSRHYFLSSGHNKAVPALPTLTAFGESNPIWSTTKTFESGPLIASDKNIQISNIAEQPFEISFELIVFEQTSVVVRRIYFPGWKLKVDNKPRTLSIIDGLTAFYLDAGRWQVELSFEETPIRKAANSITLFSIIVLFASVQTKRMGGFKFIH